MSSKLQLRVPRFSLSGVCKALIPAALVAPSFAFAALATEVTTAMTAADTDTKALAALVFIIILGIAVYKWFHRTVR